MFCLSIFLCQGFKQRKQTPNSFKINFAAPHITYQDLTLKLALNKTLFIESTSAHKTPFTEIFCQKPDDVKEFE